MTSTASATGWQAHLNLGFQRQAQRTILGQCAHRGPLQVQRPFYPEGKEVCHVAILHPPGGVVGGDRLRIDATLDPGAHALLTTPAAGKFYRSAGPFARQRQHLTVATGAALEWLPQENIVYQGARIQTSTRIDLQGDARFLGWEILCLGRPAAGERFEFGECRQNFELWRDGEPLYLEQGRYTGGEPVLAAHWGLQGQPASATLLAAGSPPGLVADLRAALEPSAGEARVSVSQLDGVLVCRYLGPSATMARQLLTLAWGLLRPALLDRPPCPSRFWIT
ncbi:MAG: urease accessory protein UreD [Candidatus Competibacter phosphatis]